MTMDAYQTYIASKTPARRAPTFAEVICSDEADHTTGQKIARWLRFLLYAIPLAILTLPTVIVPFLIIGGGWPTASHTRLTRMQERELRGRQHRAIMRQGYEPFPY